MKIELKLGVWKKKRKNKINISTIKFIYIIIQF